jgi:hypothetical protein
LEKAIGHLAGQRPSATATEPGKRYLSAPLGSQARVWGCIALISMLAPATASQPPVIIMVESRDLSPYRHGMKPPECDGQAVEGPMVWLASVRGRVVLPNFWAS